MLAINDDGRFALPAGADRDFTTFLKQNHVACVGVGQVRSPFDPANVQKLYLEWVKRRQRRIRRRIVITPVVVTTVIVVICAIFVARPTQPPGLRPQVADAAAPPAPAIGDEPKSAPYLLTEVDRILKSMTLGNIAFNTPASMRCDEKTKIQLLLSSRTAIEELKQKISGLGEKVGG